MITVPVYEDDGYVQLYDMYLDGKWIGSRRLPKQCADYFQQMEMA